VAGLVALALLSVIYASCASMIGRSIAVDFDGERAFEHVKRLVSFGPRSVGSEGHARAVDYIVKTLEADGLRPEKMEFVAHTPDGDFKMTNIIATIGSALTSVPAAPGEIPSNPDAQTAAPSSPERDTVVLCAHYDTKRFPFRFVGANDGGSGTAALLELAHVLTARRPNRRVVLVFFDGEEAFHEWEGSDHTYGSRYLAEVWKSKGYLGRIKALILMDMIGYSDLRFMRDQNSSQWLENRIWQMAAAQSRRGLFSDDAMAIDDDHIPFVVAGVPAAVLIDFQYGPNGSNDYWHTAEDTLDKISSKSLQIVGRVIEGVTREFK
jgi:hypothetical protein